LRIKMWLMATVLIGLLLSFSASAETIAPPCGMVPIQQVNYAKTVEVDKFDPSLGELKSVTITVDACGYGWRTLTNQDKISTGVDYYAILTANMVSSIPSIGDHILQIGDTFDFHLDPNESYNMLIGSQESPKCDYDKFIIDDPADLAAYIGEGEKLSIPVITNSNIQVAGSTEWSSSGETYMGVTVCVTYEYDVPACISGKKINDHTGQGIEGWIIDLLKDGAVIRTTQTDSDGSYEFCGLLPGDYEVCEEDRDGWKHMDEPCRGITLSGVDVEGVDFRNVPLLCISGHKFNSKTGEGISGWSIQLEDSTGDVIATTTTGTEGYYEFCELVPGDYVVREESRDGWKHVDPEDPYTAVALDDKDVEGIDFYNVPLFSISGHKFNYNTQEGLSGWTISLLKDDVLIATTTTDADGYYEFLKLEPGDYEVCEEDRDGWKHMDERCRDITLSGENVADVDFTNAPLLCISGHKFNSKTGEGISGWSIKLEDSTGDVITTTITDTEGYYEFCGLMSGDYVVREESRDGWKHVDPEDPHIAVVLDDKDVEDIDFYNVPLLSISGHKFNYNTQEGLSGWTISLLKDDVPIATTTTDADGYYEFLKLEPGDYVVCEEDRDGWKHMDERCRDITLSGEDVAGVDFTNAPLLCISGHKFNSKTGEGISGWSIQLEDSTGDVITTTTTDTEGYYEFCGLMSGDYVVREESRDGWKHVDPEDPYTAVVLDDKDVEDIDFYNVPLFSISGHKFNYNTQEGLSGWTISLLKDDVPIATTTTDADGYYEFLKLEPGDYVVCEEDRDGWKHMDERCRDITLSGEDVAGVDFTNAPLLCISGHKFNSKTGEGISGWSIQLEDSTGDVITTTTTDTEGYYEFCGLMSGDYVVREESRDGWKHVDPEDPYTAVVLDDKDVEDIDFYNVPLFSISGHKFNYNTQEGLSGWTISLLKDDVPIATTTTGAGGYYEFLKLEPGDYEVCEEDKAGWQHMDEPCRDITLSGEDVEGVDFHNVPLLCISGHKFNSKTGEGISGWSIQLEDSTGDVITTTTTDTEGYYEFCGLMSGDYVVREESRDGWKHVDPEDPYTAVVLDDENVEDIDFYNVPLFSISGHKFNYNTQEGLSGWTISLLKDDVPIATTTTGAGGYYEFLKLEPGDYVVCEEDKAGWQHMDEPCRDVTLEFEDVTDVDFTNAPLLCISGHKFNSETGDGLSGWSIQLKDSTGAVIATTTTGTGGYYEFCGLEAGDYEVCEVLKSGWKAVGPICIDVTLISQDSTDNDFENEPDIPPCVCPFLIKNDLYTASCDEVKVVDADNGILANDPAGSVVLNPESITIDPKYGTIEVNEDGSFVYDPTVATGRISSGSYVIFKYNANNGYCDSKYPGIAKIQVSCPRR
jgi:protocatechuate 3,4-dioxygenase beta subunit